MRTVAPRDRRAPGPAGFSLLEVVVTLAVLAVALALSGRLVLESQLGLLRTQAELANPLPRYALTRLRADVEGAASVPAILSDWRSSPLVAIASDGGRVAWRLSGEELERRVLDGAGATLVRHVALREVAGWRWRAAAPGLVDVELTYRARDPSGVPLAGVPRTWAPPTVERSVWARIALRAEAQP